MTESDTTNCFQKATKTPPMPECAPPAEAKTLRDEFAMAAMPELLRAALNDIVVIDMAGLCSESYEYADAMLEARK